MPTCDGCSPRHTALILQDFTLCCDPKHYGDIYHIPEDLRDPFYTDQYDQEHIKPPVLQLLLSCELYCRVCALILKADQAASLQSHMSVIQALSRKGIYVMESDDAPVRDADLSCVPIKMSAHMPMIDALMMAYTVEMISIEKVVACVKRFSTFSASKELPFDLEDAMVFWINKVNLKMREITERELKVKQHPLESPSHQKVRYRREHALGRQLPFFPLLEDLMRDVCDGAALLTVVHYYCPDHMKLHDICLKEVTSIADSLYNIQLLKQFSNEYLNKSFYLTMEDMLYSPLVLKHNVMVFIAELFWWFETVKPEFVQPRMEEFRDAMAQPKSARPSVPISNATKRSFQVTPGIPEASLSVSAQSSPDGRYSLYPAEGSDPLPRKTFDEEEESAKLMEDLKVKEKRDKDKGDDCSSGRSSPCLSTHSQASSLASGSVRMTSFAERKAQQRFGSSQDLRTSASSSQRTTPDGSECSGPLSLPTSRRLKMDQSPSMPQGGRGDGGTNMLASELVQLHMQLEEKRKAIEHQKKKMEMLSARQRQKLGKAAFLHIVKKGKSDTLCSPGLLLDEELDLDECNRSIEMLNDAIGSIQQQMMQLSLQQDLLMKQNVQSPPRVPSPCSVNEKTSGSEPKARPAVHFVDLGSGAPTTGTAPSRKPPKLSSARGPRTKTSELKLAKEHGRPGLASSRAITPPHSLETLPHLRQFPGGRSPRADHPDVSSKTPSAGGETISGQDKPGRRATFRLHDEANLRTAAHIEPVVVTPEVSFEPCLSSTLREGELNSSDGSGKENIPLEEVSRSKAPLIEVDLSDLKDPEEMEGDGGQDSTMDGEEGEQKSGLGFFFKDEQKAEDELAKKRAAFLIRQQKKAEETRLRKMQLEAETEQKREEARRKAEEDRMRKEEEKARRELIKEQYLRRKQQELMEEQGLGSPAKPKTAKPKPKKLSHQTHRPKSAFTDNLSSVQSGSSLSLASAATTEADSVNSGVPGSQRGESVESFPGLSRNASRNTDRDWDNGSTASSITSMAEYTGPKLFREPSSKSNKPIIFNAISHCCLAGKVNEPQKNTLLEELERVDAHHLMILFRDGGCQFRGVYSYFPDTEEILKLTGTGPKSISKKMIDKLYKYSSDRKQFTVIPAKTVSVSIDAITIHNHLWQAKRTTVPKKSGK
uniref:Calmodulin regulated spectrin-associated protein 1b n=1 Tax=Oncorhynchus kisutch TaxID=8019 RepID=A0A8C7GYC2_ONCKI